MQVNLSQYSKGMRWFMVIAWIAIVAKCALVWWAIGRWNVPIHPAWVVGPTLAFAALATVVWLAHQPE